MTVIYPMPLLSEGQPSYTNDDFGTSFPASWGNDSTFGGAHAWRCATAPVGGANDGNLTQTVWWVLDLSAWPVSQRQNVIFCWQNSAISGAYAPDLISNFPNNLLKNYTIQVNNGAGGGSPPISGWSTVATITGNTLHSRQNLVNMAGANWIGVYITAIHGSSGNNNAQGKFKVFDAHIAASDSWWITGDSITQRGFMDDEQNGFGQIIPKQIHGTFSGFYPLWEGAGEGGWTATDYQPNFAGWLANFPGKWVCLNFGTNDANLGGTYVTNYSSMMQSMITSAANAGKTVIIPTIPWLNTTTQAQTNVNTLNTQIAALIAGNANCIAGPDLYGFFSTHQSDISSDGLHPTDPALGTGNGYVDYKAQWDAWAGANIYNNVLVTECANKYKVRAVMKTQAANKFYVRAVMKTQCANKFLIKLVNTGPKAYEVVSVNTVMQPKPFTTINSQAVVIDVSNTVQTALTVSVTVTYPDASTATPTVYILPSGSYSTSYQTKGPGQMTELWTFTDGNGGQVEYQNTIAVAY